MGMQLSGKDNAGVDTTLRRAFAGLLDGLEGNSAVLYSSSNGLRTRTMMCLPAGLAAKAGRNFGASAALGSGSSLTKRVREEEDWRVGVKGLPREAEDGCVHQSDMVWEMI